MNPNAERCLLCKNARCQAACPVHTPIPEVMNLYRQNRMEEAGKILFENNPLSAITSLVCDWDRVCYGHCVLNAKKQPIPFYEIEQEISMPYLMNLHLSAPASNGKKIAVIGGGPAGIAGALILSQKGYEVHLFEMEPKLGGVLRYGIPEFRLKKTAVDRLEELLKESGVSIHVNVHADMEYRMENLLKQGYAAVLAAIGAGQAKGLNIPGEEMHNVLYAIDFLKHPEQHELGEQVIVIGGGNVAMDASRTAVRQGKNTSIYYRKTFENMPAAVKEIEEAKSDGVQFHVFEAPTEVREHSVIFCRCENVTDENGKIRTEILKGTEHEVPCDTLIIAASQTAGRQDMEMLNLPEDRWGMPVSEDNGSTSVPGLFLAGDLKTGASTVAYAVEGAKLASEALDTYCREK